TVLGSATSVKATRCQSASCRNDTTPPTDPSGVKVTATTGNSIAISWTASTDNYAVYKYRLYRNGAYVGSTSSTAYTFGSLSCGTSYQLGAQAVDYAGNWSAKASISAPTSACPDTQAPTTPTGLNESSGTQTALSASWSASSDNVGVAGYD